MLPSRAAYGAESSVGPGGRASFQHVRTSLIGDEEHRRGLVGFPSSSGGGGAPSPPPVQPPRRASDEEERRPAARQGAHAPCRAREGNPGISSGHDPSRRGMGSSRACPRDVLSQRAARRRESFSLRTHEERRPGAGVPDRPRAGPRSRAGERARFTACSRHDRSRSGVDPPRERAHPGRRGTSVLQWREPLDLRRAAGDRVEPGVSRRVGARL